MTDAEMLKMWPRAVVEALAAGMPRQEAVKFLREMDQPLDAADALTFTGDRLWKRKPHIGAAWEQPKPPVDAA